MNINSIDQSNLDVPQNKFASKNTLESSFTGRGKDYISNHFPTSNSQDSISLSKSASSQTESTVWVNFKSRAFAINNSIEARSSVNSIITLLNNNGSEIFSSLKAPTSSAVLNLVYDTAC